MQMLPRLPLGRRELDSAVRTLLSYLGDRSNIVRTFAMQALADLARREACAARAKVIPILEEHTSSGSPAMRSRGRKLLRQLKETTAHDPS